MGLIGGEDHGELPVGRHEGHLLDQDGGVGGRRIDQVMSRDVFGVGALAHLGVRADREGPERHLGLVGPLAQGLVEQ